MTESVLARHVLCIPGAFVSKAAVADLVDGLDAQLLDKPEPRMLDAFEACADRVSPTFGEADREAVKAHKNVLYVLSPPVEHETALTYARRVLLLGASLLERGGVGMKGDSSGIAHGRDRWLELAKEAAEAARSADNDEEAALDLVATLYAAFVRRPLRADNGDLYTCGLHLLGERDILMTESDVDRFLDVADAFALYSLGEGRDLGGVKEGHTFRTDRKAAKYKITHEPCLAYEPDDFFHNPHGYARLTRV
jgi:hypothetical protein